MFQCIENTVVIAKFKKVCQCRLRNRLPDADNQWNHFVAFSKYY